MRAQGGSVSEQIIGGYGAYSVGNIVLHNGDKLYINVGGQGASQYFSNSLVKIDGGYNGGGAAYGTAVTGYRSSGGGATLIANSTGLLSELSVDDIIIVAGGGGGSGYFSASASGSGGSGGGASAADGVKENASKNSNGLAGTQLAGGTGPGSNGSFGLGADAVLKVASLDSRNLGGSGGGGGYYGGGSSFNNSGAGGGSGYIGNDSLTNKVMYCYGCTESDVESTYTVSTTGESLLVDSINCSLGYSSDSISGCAKSGNGYVKITYLGIQ